MKTTKLAYSLLIVAALAACKSSDTTTPAVATTSAQVLTQQELITTTKATVEQCPAGGEVYSVYIDANANGVQDADEPTLGSQTVCNGMNGSAGYSSLFNMSRVSVTTDICAAGSGVQLGFGLDTNRNGNLDLSEITQTEIICDGQNGAAGTAGPAGMDGHNMVFQVVSAPANVCVAGGTIITMALDVQNLGTYSALDPEQQSLTVCNGQTGANGQDAPAYTPLEPIMPCGDTVAYKEVLLRLSSGQVLASFSDDASGLNTRLIFLTDGSYVDTDDSNCNFTLGTSQDGQTRSISWFGQVQASWSLN